MILATSAALLSCRRQAAVEDTSGATLAIPVVAAPAQSGAIRTVVHAGGLITAPPDAEFLAVTLEPGTILDMPRMEGESVASGDLLVRLDIPSATLNVARQQADLARAQATFENARTAQARARDLVERGLVPRVDLDAADRELADAQAAVARAQAALTEAQTNASRGQIRAPFAGIVVKRFHNPGDVVQGLASDPILRFVDASRLEVTATVPAEDAGRVAQGATARVADVTSGPPVRLTVASRAPASREGTDVLVRLLFAEPTTLQVETVVQVDIDAEERANAVFVPAEAVVREGAVSFVYLVAGDKAVKRAVLTGLQDDTRIEITQGVASGDLVLTQGHIDLPDGATISIDTSRR